MAANPLVKKITALLDAEAPDRQVAAAIVLGAIGVRDAAVNAALIRAATGAAPAVKRHALEALGLLGARQALPVALGLVGSRDEALRAAAIGTASAFEDDAVAQVRERLAQVTDALERRGLEEILARAGGKDAFSALLGALDTADVEAAKAAALAARQRIKAASPRERNGYLAEVTKRLEGKPATRTAALTAAALKILGYLEDPRATPILLRYAKDEGAAEPVRQEALVALRFTSDRATAARTAGALLDIAEDETAPLALARTSLYTLASLAVPPAIARRLGALALGGGRRGAAAAASADRAQLAQLAVERLAQMPGEEASAELAAILAKTSDRAQAEAAATALGARPDAASALGRALLDATDADRIGLLAKLLAPHARALASGGAADKKLGRAVIAAAVARATDPAADAGALVTVARAVDATATSAGLRAAAEKASRARSGAKATTKTAMTTTTKTATTTATASANALVAWRRLGHSADATPEDGYALAAAELAGGRRDEALTILSQLVGRGFDVPAALRRDRAIDDNQRYQIGFAFAEQRHAAGEEILSDLVKAGGRNKIAQMAKAKLKSSGYE